ncbi:MAG: hypothetical protein PVH55_08225 [Desulfobacterales bacterium]|jgi:hypothetical protein
MLCSYSNAASIDLEAIQSLEKDLGKTLLAFSCQDIKPAEIKDEELFRINELEKKLGVVLVAVEQ